KRLLQVCYIFNAGRIFKFAVQVDPVQLCMAYISYLMDVIGTYAPAQKEWNVKRIFVENRPGKSIPRPAVNIGLGVKEKKIHFVYIIFQERKVETQVDAESLDHLHFGPERLAKIRAFVAMKLDHIKMIFVD